jgi:glycosyltransferase involved in cell wall biosynthesis
MTTLQTSPQLTIIIPTRNEASFIDRCLRSVFAADPVPSGFEVLVVDGMSKDGTRQILSGWIQEHANLTILDNPLGIVPSAMNIGIRAARGEWIIRLDAHSEYPANYFNLCIETNQRTGADNVGGAITTLFERKGLQGSLVQALTTHRFGVGNSTFRTGAREGWADTVPFGCYRRELFKRIGLYDERLVRNQDYELNRRLLEKGGRIWFNPAIQIIYHNQSTLHGLLRQAFTTGQWNPWMWFIAPYSFALRHAVPMIFVSILLFVSLLFLMAPSMASILLLLVMVPYTLLALSASFQQALRCGVQLFLPMPWLFLVYHIIYGSGGLWGLCRLLLQRAPVQGSRHAFDVSKSSLTKSDLTID